MYTLEIGGRPIAIINSDQYHAEQWFGSGIFRSELIVFETADGKPLWPSEDEADLFVRKSFPEEEAVLEKRFAKARAAGEVEPDEEENYLVYLLPIRDPTDDAFDDDGNLIGRWEG